MSTPLLLVSNGVDSNGVDIQWQCSWLHSGLYNLTLSLTAWRATTNLHTVISKPYIYIIALSTSNNVNGVDTTKWQNVNLPASTITILRLKWKFLNPTYHTMFT